MLPWFLFRGSMLCPAFSAGALLLLCVQFMHIGPPRYLLTPINYRQVVISDWFFQDNMCIAASRGTMKEKVSSQFLVFFASFLTLERCSNSFCGWSTFPELCSLSRSLDMLGLPILTARAWLPLHLRLALHSVKSFSVFIHHFAPQAVTENFTRLFLRPGAFM